MSIYQNAGWSTGGRASGPAWPKEMLVDYLRVYKPVGGYENGYVDTAALEKLIEAAKAEAEKTDIYTTESIQGLASSISESEALVKKDGVTKAEIEQQVQALQEAINGLVRRTAEETPKKPEVSVKAENITVAGLENAVELTEEEQAALENGKSIKIQMVADELGQESIGNDMLELIQGAMTQGEVIAKILDINIEKIIDGQDSKKITQLKTPVHIVIDVPESFVNSDNTVKRSFSVIRLHEGQATVLKDMDDNEKTVTIYSDKFSLYALTYQDESDNNPGNDPGNKPGNDPGTASGNKPGTDLGGNSGSNKPGSQLSGGTQTQGGTQNMQPIFTPVEKPAEKSTAPKTGDMTPIGIYLLLLCLALGTGMIVCFRKHRHNSLSM